jgi:hypothetical protein
MDEFTGQFHLEPDDGFASGVTLDRTAVNRSRVALQRRRQLVTRRGPRRGLINARTLFQSFGAGWTFDFSDAGESARVLLEAIADKGSGQAITGGNSWTIGRPNGHRTFSAYAMTADGRSYRLHRGIAQEVALTVEPNRLVGAEARFEFSELTEVAAASADTVADPHAFASGMTASVTWGGVALDAFALALNFARDITPARMTPDGVFTGALGNPVCDITGRLSCRVPVEDDDLFLAQVTRSLAVTVEAGAVTLAIEFPSVVFESLQRGVVSSGTVEHLVQFLARKDGSSPIATISLLES